MIKIVHTGDLHIGLEFSRYPGISDRLKKERLDSLKTIVDRANRENAHALVVAGDLFEKLSVPQKLVKEVRSILATFNGEVIIIPGNHDWYNKDADDNKVWDWFIDGAGANIHFLYELKPFTCTLNEQELVFYPCGCHQKHSDTNRIGWIANEELNKETINIGLAHGNVDGYGLDEEGNYFGMSIEELRNAGMLTWLLGHIHAPYPVTETAGQELFFFSGNHCADSWRSERPGGCWLMEISDDRKVKATRWQHQGIIFKDRQYTVNNLTDVEACLQEIRSFDAGNTVLRVKFNGALPEQEVEPVKKELEVILQQFLYQELRWEVKLHITPELIDKLYVKGSIGHGLQTKLAAADDKLGMQLAYDLIKNLQP